MAPSPNVLRTCGLLVCLIFKVLAISNSDTQPSIQSYKVGSKLCEKKHCKYLLNVRGGEFLGHKSWRLTSEERVKGGKCDIIYPNYELKEIETTQWESAIEIILPINFGKIYFCLRDVVKEASFSGQWVHQGVDIFLEYENDILAVGNENSSANPSSTEPNQNRNADLLHTPKDWIDLSHDIDVNYNSNRPRPARVVRDDIEVMINDKYVPLNDINDELPYQDADQNIDMFNDVFYNSVSNNNGKQNNDSNKLTTDETRTHSNNHIETNNNLDINDAQKFQRLNISIEDAKSIPVLDNSEIFSLLDNDKIASYLNSNVTATDDVNNNIEFDDEESRKSSENVKQNFTDITPNDNRESELNTLIFESESGLDAPNNRILIRKPRQEIDMGFTSVKADPIRVLIEGIRIENSAKEPKITDEGIPSVLGNSAVTLRVFGVGLTSRTVIAFTHDEQEFGQPCKFLLKGEHMVKEGSLQSNTALFQIAAPDPITGSKLYICAKNLRPGISDPSKDEEKYMHQGTETWKQFASHKKLLPLWATLSLILFCLMFSALFSGLNLGLMSLDRTELKIISNTGTEQERKYARAIMPVRDHGNYLLCSILLGNVAVNSTFTILLDELTSGLFAVIFSTLAIVLLGEITPQAICSRHGLMVGAKSIMITKGVMAITAPLAYPVSKILDYLLGEEISNVYNRERLKELVKLTTDVNDLDKDEVNIISGALELRKKKVSEVMTKLEDVFMLPVTSILDFETMSEIVKSGYSRIPVFEGSRVNIVTVLFIKDLAFVDPDDNTPLRTLCQYYQNACNFVFEDVTLDIMFKQFKDGHKGHMAFVHRINNEGEGDPFYETIGLVTLEDVIEEMIQAEIVDETDVFMDNRSKRRRNKPQHKLQDFAAFAERHENQRIHISPQLTLATFQFLSTSVDAFRPDTVSETVLRRLLKQDVIQHIKLKGKTKRDISTYVFQQGKPVDYFVLILEGRVEVTVGRENLVFEAGPFTYFGVQALTQNVGVAESPTPSAMGSLQNLTMDAMLRHTFVPDYSVRAITELFYLTVKRSLYLAAKRATLMEKGALSKGSTNEQFDTEVDKLLQSVDEDISISGEHKTPSRQVSPHPLPVSPAPRASFALEPRADADVYARADEQEKLLK